MLPTQIYVLLALLIEFLLINLNIVLLFKTSLKWEIRYLYIMKKTLIKRKKQQQGIILLFTCIKGSMYISGNGQGQIEFPECTAKRTKSVFTLIFTIFEGNVFLYKHEILKHAAYIWDISFEIVFMNQQILEVNIKKRLIGFLNFSTVNWGSL